MKRELEKLYDHINDIEIAMMTTRRSDGHLQSRAMAAQRQHPEQLQQAIKAIRFNR